MYQYKIMSATATATMIQEVVAIMDRSGSMRGKVEDSVGGFNTTLEVLREEKEENAKINVSVKLFDNEEILLFSSLPLEEVRPLEVRQFVPRGQTALLDAIGNTVTHFMEKKLMDPAAYDCCTIYVVTDGLENCSRSYTHSTIKKLVQAADEKYNIKVIYLAANQDAILEARNIGIGEGQAINYSETSAETNAVYRSAASMVKRHRSSDPFEFLPAERSASQSCCTPPVAPALRMPPPPTRSGHHISQISLDNTIVGPPPLGVDVDPPRLMRQLNFQFD
ncbi:hypothetical protein PGAG_00111 [Phaeocystis globosa virus 12T]|uniref:von Willebrand factor type A domain-containing protein n=1 Tax=Phaeocystis globosa virus PgV-16T TaxID=3071227 RepID=A0AC59EX06_9VIRU|nr:von Willebrand factor type A domain-containing protein [Phaeocystis globosa virus]AET73000.1 hypothetical protein PGAG_00111 [Phaeocystis globosa virus 12T]AET73822.1 hypothetical protein PGBG_00114 [Phaeocystis globosa virus 14T]AGM15463.1 von Willebrand factor type A domain-containing protein [Phaeocystis globosa virus PgV-16T]UYE94193.1 von Willebrand factor type A domain-containing protein [Phaeocystis globosa virus]